MQSTMFAFRTRPANFAFGNSAFGRSDRLPLAVAMALGLLVGVMVYGQLPSLTFPVKLAILALIGTPAAALVFSRPVLFPLCAYVFIVPFDTLLQTGTGTITKFLGVASAVVMVLVLTDRRRVIGAPVVVGLWALYLAWNIASYMWSEVPMYRNELLIANIQLFAIFAIASMVRVRVREMWMLLGAALAGGTAFAAFGVWIYRNASSSVSGSAGDRLAIQMSGTSYVNSDHFSAALIMPIALALVGFLHFGGWRKAMFAAALLVILAGVYVSGTRGSFIAIGAMWLFLLVSYRRPVQLAVIAAIGLLASIPFPNVWIRFFDPTQGEAGGRYSIWAIAWDAFKHRPLLGIGADGFRIAYGESYLAAARGRLISHWWQDAHNVIVSNAVELGIIGLVLVLAAWFYQFRIARSIPRSSPLFGARLAIEAGTLGLFVNALSVDLMFYKYLWMAFMLGAFVRSAYLGEQQAVESAELATSATADDDPGHVLQPAATTRTFA
jgi:O-antigen ligase